MANVSDPATIKSNLVSAAEYLDRLAKTFSEKAKKKPFLIIATVVAGIALYIISCSLAYVSIFLKIAAIGIPLYGIFKACKEHLPDSVQKALETVENTTNNLWEKVQNWRKQEQDKQNPGFFDNFFGRRTPV